MASGHRSLGRWCPREGTDSRWPHWHGALLLAARPRACSGPWLTLSPAHCGLRTASSWKGRGSFPPRFMIGRPVHTSLTASVWARRSPGSLHPRRAAGTASSSNPGPTLSLADGGQRSRHSSGSHGKPNHPLLGHHSGHSPRHTSGSFRGSRPHVSPSRTPPFSQGSSTPRAQAKAPQENKGLGNARAGKKAERGTAQSGSTSSEPHSAPVPGLSGRG